MTLPGVDINQRNRLVFAFYYVILFTFNTALVLFKKKGFLIFWYPIFIADII